MVDLSPFIATANRYINPAFFANDTDPRGAFLDELKAAGYTPPDRLEIGHLARLRDPQDKPHKRTGWMIYNEFPDRNDASKVFAVGVYGSWRDPDGKNVWTSRRTDSLSPEDRLHYLAQIDAARAIREAEERVRWSEAAAKASAIWQDSTSPAPADHPYLVKKRISACGVRLSRDALAIPVMIAQSDAVAIASLQFIHPDGTKLFLTGGKTRGGFYAIQGDDSLPIYITEGYATGATIHDATGATVYCAFSAANLYEIAAMVKRQHGLDRIIIIAGDDDVYSTGNAGRTKATQAAEALGLPVIFPTFANPADGMTDFNDLAVAESLSIVKAQLLPEQQASSAILPYDRPDMGKSHDAIVEPPPGFLRDCYDYYNATSGNDQKGFAAQTALALGSIIVARSYHSDKLNFSSLYLLNVGKSGTGKEHSKTVIEQVLSAASMDHLIAGDGYTSAGAVFSALLDRPRHISVIDEFGRYLEAGAAGKFGNHHQREANTKLMESIGRSHTIMRPPTYSTMTLKKADADVLKSRRVSNPAITLLTMTTPTTLFDTLDTKSIKDGFINRFIISISNAARSLRQHKAPLPVPEVIKDWIAAIENRAGNTHNAAESPNFVQIAFSIDALAMQDDYQLFCIDQADNLEKFGMAELPGRSNEMAMRIALICALSRDPMTDTITADDMAWSIAYVKHNMMQTISKIKMTISASEFEGHKKEVLQALREASPNWIKFSTMNKAQPYTKHQRKYLIEILDSLTDAELIDVQQAAISGRGRPTKEYRAIK